MKPRRSHRRVGRAAFADGPRSGLHVALVGVVASAVVAALVVLTLRATVGLEGRATLVPASRPPRDACARRVDALFPEGLQSVPSTSERLDRIVHSRTRGYFEALAFARGRR